MTQNSAEKVTASEPFIKRDEYIAQMSRSLDRGPYFDASATKNVTSLVGKTGHLNCRIRNLGNKTVCIAKYVIFKEYVFFNQGIDKQV